MSHQRQMFLRVVLVGLLAATSGISFAVRAQEGWRLHKIQDPLNDSVTYTAVLRSNDEHASLRIHCDTRGWPIVFIGISPDLKFKENEFTVAEVRFDKDEADGFLLHAMRLDIDVRSRGGSSDQVNFSFVDVDFSSFNNEITVDHARRAGERLLGLIRAKETLAYRLTLAESGDGAVGVFSLRGFDRAAGQLLKTCSIR